MKFEETTLSKPEQKIPAGGDDTKKEKPLSRQELVAEEYRTVIDLREEKYGKDIEKDPKAESMRSALETHNNIVLGYADELIERNENLTDLKFCLILLLI